MNRIFKFELSTIDETVIEVRGYHFKPLSIQAQHGKPVLWAEVSVVGDRDTNFFVRPRVTGGEVPNNPDRRFLGTVQLNEGTLVLHYYQLV